MNNQNKNTHDITQYLIGMVQETHHEGYIKKLAKRLSKESDRSHGHALDYIVQQIGYLNWNDYKKQQKEIQNV